MITGTSISTWYISGIINEDKNNYKTTYIVLYLFAYWRLIIPQHHNKGTCICMLAPPCAGLARAPSKQSTSTSGQHRTKYK